jgi:hypothetical protein
MLAWLVRGLAPSATVEIEDMDFSKMTLAVQIAEVLNYDDRTPPNWHGHTRSYASPREGANEERLVISLDEVKVRLKGFDEAGRKVDIQCPLSIEQVLERVLGAAVNGVRSVTGFVTAVRTGNLLRQEEGSELVYEF